MNENFFGKYSVFCVFGSVVGCVVVPLIAQVLQQQSMECMILSAIFLTFTAAHLKKGGNDSHHGKILLSREEKKKYTSQSNSSNKKQKPNHVNSSNSNQKHQTHQQQHQNEQEYIQQFEHLKILEMEKRNEEKRLKKQKKREERLKRKEEESRKLKEYEERKAAKEKRKKKIENSENICRNANNPQHITIAKTYEKYCCGDSTQYSSQYNRKPRSYSQDESQTYTNKHSYLTKRHNIPRFNNQQRKCNAQYENTNYARSNTDSLSINCSSLSTSCSSLSSIGSSGSCSPPPPPTSPKCVNIGSAWKTPCQTSDSESTKSLSPHKYENNGIALRQDKGKIWTFNERITEEPNNQRVLKSYSNVRATRNKSPTYNLNSSSLFCSTQEESSSKQQELNNADITTAGEYSLFGSHQFGSSFIKSPII